MEAKKITVHGKVQGVGFRYFVQHVADRLGLEGNVRNCPDLTVEILVEGDAEGIEAFIDRIKQGPPLSWVQRVEVVSVPVKGGYGAFLIEGR